MHHCRALRHSAATSTPGNDSAHSASFDADSHHSGGAPPRPPTTGNASTASGGLLFTAGCSGRFGPRTGFGGSAVASADPDACEAGSGHSVFSGTGVGLGMNALRFSPVSVPLESRFSPVSRSIFGTGSGLKRDSSAVVSKFWTWFGVLWDSSHPAHSSPSSDGASSNPVACSGIWTKYEGGIPRPPGTQTNHPESIARCLTR